MSGLKLLVVSGKAVAGLHEHPHRQFGSVLYAKGNSFIRLLECEAKCILVFH